VNTGGPIPAKRWAAAVRERARGPAYAPRWAQTDLIGPTEAALALECYACSWKLSPALDSRLSYRFYCASHTIRRFAMK
jgi:hypothetical protein